MACKKSCIPAVSKGCYILCVSLKYGERGIFCHMLLTTFAIMNANILNV